MMEKISIKNIKDQNLYRGCEGWKEAMPQAGRTIEEMIRGSEGKRAVRKRIKR